MGWRGQVNGGAKPFVPPGLCLNVLHIFEPASQPARPPCTDAGVRAIMSPPLGRLVSASNSHVLQHLCGDDGMDVRSG